MRTLNDPIEKEVWLKEVPILQASPLLDAVHRNRCEADPIYQLLFFPTQPIEVHDPVTGALVYTTTFIDRFIDGIYSMMKKRYGPALQKERLIVEMFEILQGSLCDAQLKTFVMMFLIKWEPSVGDLVRDLYEPDAKGSLFGTESIDQYNSLLRRLDHWVEQTITFPFSQFSIVQLVQNFLQACTTEYIMGPFQ